MEKETEDHRSGGYVWKFGVNLLEKVVYMWRLTMTSSYERIKSECKKKNQLWEDPDFPAVQTSVFYHQTPPFTFQWKRPQEILAQPVFINDSTTQFDITPGKMGDRWLVSCLGVLYLSKGKSTSRFQDQEPLFNDHTLSWSTWVNIIQWLNQRKVWWSLSNYTSLNLGHKNISFSVEMKTVS